MPLHGNDNHVEEGLETASLRFGQAIRLRTATGRPVTGRVAGIEIELGQTVYTVRLDQPLGGRQHLRAYEDQVIRPAPQAKVRRAA